MCPICAFCCFPLSLRFDFVLVIDDDARCGQLRRMRRRLLPAVTPARLAPAPPATPVADAPGGEVKTASGLIYKELRAEHGAAPLPKLQTW